MWTGFQIENLKGYADTGPQELRRLTVLMGPNGGGKSTILQAFLLLKQTLESPDRITPLVSNPVNSQVGYVDLGDFGEYVHGSDAKSWLRLKLQWDPQDNPRAAEHGDARREACQELAAADMRFSQRNREVVMQILEFQERDGSPLVSITRGGTGTYRPLLAKSLRGNTKQLTSRREYEPWKFCRFAPAMLAALPPEAEEALRCYSQELEERLWETYYVGPLRDHPRRVYESTGGRPSDVGTKGQAMGSALLAARGETVLDLANEWMKRLGIAENLVLEKIGKGPLFCLKIQGAGQSHAVNLASYGFGASQILPVLIECLYCPDGASVLIEQPEIHLNAHHQLELPNFFAEQVSTTRKQFIVETHSEYFFKRLGTLVAKGRLNPQDVIVLYCHADADGSHITPITLDDLGQYSSWPRGFLSEGFEGSAEHRAALLARLAADEAQTGEAGDV